MICLRMPMPTMQPTFDEMVEKHQCVESPITNVDHLFDCLPNVPLVVVQLVKIKKYFKSNTRRFLARLTSNDYHAVVMIHSSIGVLMYHPCCSGVTYLILRNEQQHDTFMKNHVGTWFKPTTPTFD